MVGSYRNCEILSGLLYGIFLLLTLSANCNGDILNQTKAMLREMQYEARELFNESFEEHEILENDCKKSYPNDTIVNMKNPLQRIKESLNFFSKAFELLFEREKDEYMHATKLEVASKKSEALESNLLRLIIEKKVSLQEMLDEQMSKMLQTKLKLPNRKKTYYRKSECCRLINVYIDFLEVVHKIVLKIPAELK
ncbi:uncharacterized protein LOC143793958 [Ranitomeya variabilis]|uniref:uncharacterized protein LOC143793958 n=1 Tax=Ranitomeya variabilis TaxID=490064 RepID=UPI0040560BE1